jgi:hypothetical protein
MLRESNIVVTSDENVKLCSHCLDGKMSRLPFSDRIDRVDIPFYKVHSDVWGPSPVVSVEGFRYYVSFIDEATRFVWIFPIMNKSEVFGSFVKFCAYIENQFHTRVKVLQSDGGGEFLSHAFKEFLATYVILHFISCPYTPQQNGLAKRKHRHLIETAITLLSVAKLPHKFWSYAVNHATFFINRMPCKGLNMISPFGKLFGKKPDIANLKVFGSAIYPYLRPYNTNKLQPRSTQCVFLGYSPGYKGAICYSISTGKVLISRYVIHDETIFPYRHVSSTATDATSSMSSGQSSTASPIIVQLPSLMDHSSSLDSSNASPRVSVTPSLGSTSQHSSSLENAQDSTTHATLSSLMLPVQVELPPLRSSSSPRTGNTSISQGIQTRLRTGTITRKDYSALTAIFPEVQSLTLEDDDHFSGGFTFVADILDVSEPSTFKHASQIPQWQVAMQEEFDALQTQGTWVLVPAPCDKNVIGSKWVYKVKRNSDGSISRYKARLVAQGFSQEKGLDYTETFSPVVRHTTVRLILSLAAIHK